MDNFIYMIQLREFIEHTDKKNIYKIGKTRQSNYSRYTGYPKGSIIMLHINCTDCDTAEKTIINIFKKKYIHKHQYGNEYFEGDCQSMIVDIINVVYGNLINETAKQYSDNEKNVRLDKKLKKNKNVHTKWRDKKLNTTEFAVIYGCCAIADVPKELRTKEMYESEVIHNGYAIADVPEDMMTTEIYEFAVIHNGYAIADVPKELRTT